MAQNFVSEESHENELYLFISQVNLSHDLSNFNGNRIFVNTIIKLCMESFKPSKSDFINVKIWDSYVISSFVALWKIFNRKHSSFRFEVGFYLIVSMFVSSTNTHCNDNTTYFWFVRYTLNLFQIQVIIFGMKFRR